MLRPFGAAIKSRVGSMRRLDSSDAPRIDCKPPARAARVCARRRSAQSECGATRRARRASTRLDAGPPLASLRAGPMPARVGNVLVGTASWTEKTLLESGAFYPPGVKAPADRLRYYARHFPVVEVDA